MSTTKIFLGWNQPWVELFSEWLLQDAGRLMHCLVVVPTRESGRRLRECLINKAAQKGIPSLLGPRVATPDDFFRPDKLMTDAVRWAGWLTALRATPDNEVNDLFPAGMADKDDAWRLAIVQQIEMAREALISVNATFSSVAGLLPEDNIRWKQLAAIERRVVAVWKQWGFADPVMAKRERALSFSCPQGVAEIILAGVTDPMWLAAEAWRRLENTGVPITILIGAPTEQAAHFDEWGRPLPAFWADRQQHATPEPTSSLVAADATALAGAVVQACAGRNNREVAVGVCDSTFTPAIARRFQELGWRTFAPEGMPLAQDGWPELLEALAAAVDSPNDHATIARAARHPTVWNNFLNGRNARKTFFTLDEWEVKNATTNAATNIERLHHDGETTAGDLLASVQSLGKTAAAGSIKLLEDWLRARFEEEASEATADALAEMDSWPAVQAEGVTASLCLRWLGVSLASVPRSPDASDAVLALQGWLELPFDPASHLILAALHEGSVPEQPSAGPLITEAVREKLGLRDRQSRLARETFLYTAMVEGRRATGSVTAVTAQFDAQGEPCKPSRVLLQARADNLPARVLQFIKKNPDVPPGHTPAWSRGDWKLRPPTGMPANKKWEHLSPSTLKTYLACPTRFYFKKVLGWERFAPFNNALDSRSFGNLIHDVLNAWGQDKTARELADAGELRACWRELLKQLTAARFGDIASPLIRLQVMSAEERLDALAAPQAEQRRLGWHVTDVEEDFNGVLTLAGAPLHLRIDRVDRHDDGRARVIDYKTGKSAETPAKSHLRVWKEETCAPPLGSLWVSGKRSYAWKDLQLPLYAGAVKKHFNLDQIPEAYYALMPEAVGETAFAPFENLAEKMDNAVEWAEEAARRILAGVFWPPSPEVDFNEFATIAPEGLAAALGEEWAAFLAGGDR